MTLVDIRVLFAKIDDRLCRFGFQRKKFEAGLGLVSFNPSCGSKPPIHGLLALASRACNDCFHAKERVILLGNNNTAPYHPSQQGLMLCLSFLSLPCKVCYLEPESCC